MAHRLHPCFHTAVLRSPSIKSFATHLLFGLSGARQKTKARLQRRRAFHLLSLEVLRLLFLRSQRGLRFFGHLFRGFLGGAT